MAGGRSLIFRIAFSPIIAQQIDETGKLTYDEKIENVARYRGYKTLWRQYPSVTLTPTRTTLWNQIISSFTWRRRIKSGYINSAGTTHDVLRQGNPCTRVTWDGPSKWVTPRLGSFLIWKWTTTNGTTMPFRDNFYDFLIDHVTSVGGTTEHWDTLPTLRAVSGTTRVWRFWSLSTDFNNSRNSRIDTYLALETEGRPFGPTRRSTTTLINTNLADNTAVVLCYVCGLNKTGIPRHPACYDVFDNPDKVVPDRRRKYRRICYTGMGGEDRSRWYGPILTTDEMRGGCFKRFTDVGHVYVERGCRTWPPARGVSFASKRFADLETLTKNKRDGCVVSPHASLTPFSRGISLYVRYHVCVCTGDLCNKTSEQFSLALSVLLLMMVVFM